MDVEFFPPDTRNLTQRSLRSERMEKGGFLIGEEIAHVPHSRDALTRGRVTSKAKGWSAIPSDRGAVGPMVPIGR